MPLQMIVVDVTYNSSNELHPFTFNPSPPDVIVVPNQAGGNAERGVCLQLTSQCDPGVTWDSTAIEWSTGNPGGGAPPSATDPVPNPGFNQVVFGIKNTNNTGTSNGGTAIDYGFKVRIRDANGNLQTSADPETVLQPPNP